MKDCCKKTQESIDRAFNEGMSAFGSDEKNDGAMSQTACPYSKRKALENHWWTRGYAYQARLFRALKAEAKL